jgi:DUF1707 SHOCT-like domain/Cell wall-active antibiotics response LiaF, C-terminal
MSDLPPQRVGDAEREQAVEVLRRASVEGRLTLEELADRAELAHAARTRDELAVVTADLAPAPAAAAPGPERRRVICSALRRNGRFSLPGHSRFDLWFGTLELDLREAVIAGSAVEIEIRNVFGTATLLVPEHVDVEVTGDAPLGTTDVRLEPPPPPPGAPVVRVSVSGLGGTVRVRATPPLRDRLASAARQLVERIGSPP